MFLRFIGGEFEGGEFPLKLNREITIGRGSEHDMVLDEDMVSRAHARISTFDGKVTLEDLGSTNGTLVNGEKVSVITLNPRDQILIGNSLLEFVTDGLSTEELMPVSTTSSTLLPRETLVANVRFMGGKVGGTSLTFFDLFTDMIDGGVTGTFEIVHGAEGRGEILFSNGEITGATLEIAAKTPLTLPTRKACLRMLLWDVGKYNFQPGEVISDVQEPLDGRVLLKQGREEQQSFAKYAAYLPAPESKLTLTTPLKPKLSALSAEVLDTLQNIINKKF
ncbi:MAG: FHA domain-containing protein, partial [Bradymonadia bacterium]